MYGAEQGVTEELDEVSLGGLLEAGEGRDLEAEGAGDAGGFDRFGDITDETLKAASPTDVVSCSPLRMEAEGIRRGTHGSLRTRSWVLFWYFLISRSATVPGLSHRVVQLQRRRRTERLAR